MPNRFLPSRIANPGALFAYITTFAAALFAGMAVYHNAQLQENTARRFIEAQVFVDLLDQLEVSLVNAQTGQRGYLLTGKQAYLQPYQEARGRSASRSGRLPAAVLLDRLAGTAGPYTQVDGELPALGALVGETLAVFEQTIELHRAGKADVALSLVISGQGEQKMNRIREALARMRAAMSRELRDLEAQRSGTALRAQVLAGVISLVSIAMLIALGLATRKANRQLALARAQLARFIESDLFGIALCDTAGGIEMANDEYLRIIGYSRRELEQGGLRWDAITPPEWLEMERKHIEEARETGVGRHYEKEYLRKNGVRVPVMLGFVFTDDARDHGVVFALDITEQKRSQALLRSQEALLQQEGRRKDEFIALLAHELRNPLAPIQTGLDLMKLTPSLLPGYADTLAIMDRQLGQLVRLIDDLLDVSRINAGKLELRMERITAVDVVHAAIEASASQIAASGQTLDLDLPDAALFLRADVMRLTQVLNNLLNNAAWYAPRGSRIRLSLKHEGHMAVFEVRDQGIGIEPETQPKVGDMFARTESGRRLSRDGLGLGLSLARRLAQMHGGSIVSRSAPGEGSSVIVSIPAEDGGEPPGAAPIAARPADLAPASRTPRRILVLDDNVDAAAMLGAVLAVKGHQIAYAHSGADAIALAREFKPEIAFLDIGLPDMSGHDVARALRSMPELQRTKLVALTGWGAARDREASRDAGIDLHLTKPARMEEILALMPELG